MITLQTVLHQKYICPPWDPLKSQEKSNAANDIYNLLKGWAGHKK